MNAKERFWSKSGFRQLRECDEHFIKKNKGDVRLFDFDLLAHENSITEAPLTFYRGTSALECE